jgi:two-component system, OmpR family, sensor histidine kinase SenX3
VSRPTLFSRILRVHLFAVAVGIAAAAALVASRPPAGVGWTFAVIVPAVCGSVVIASWLTARRLARTLKGVADQAARLGRGHPATGGPSPDTLETRQFSEAINALATELAGVIDALRDEKGLREQILVSMREGVILTDSAARLIYANPAAATMFGVERIEFVPPQLGGAGEHEFSVHHPRRRELRSTAVRLEDGRTLAVIQDETERKRVEAIRRDFVSNASHELKTPVAGILITAETVQQAMQEDPEHARGFAANLVREAHRLSKLVQDLLDLARLEHPRTQSEYLNLAQLIEGEVNQMWDRADRKGIKLAADLDETVEIRGLVDDLGLMVRNLLENALIYTPEGSVTITLSERDDWVELRVADTGVGIPTSELERIFERFYRVDKARSRATGGTGLGLSIVRHVAESHGGAVEVESELGHGSTFIVRLPSSGGADKLESLPVQL